MLNNISQIIIILITQLPYFRIFIFMTLESSFIPFPSEIVMIPAGYFAAQWKINLFLAILSWIAWSIFWALINYYIAKLWWEKISKKLIWEKYYNHWIKFFEKYGDITTLIGRLIPLIRQYISFPAGLFKMDIKKFILFTWLGAWTWITFLTLLGYWAWQNQQLIKKYKIDFFIWVIILAIFIIWIKFRFMKKFKRD